ncbi:Regulator of microtubule dynamics protein 1 [Diplonema papillatum]|nr:Regulator of microtubule dynamics protein 1 [Diplonema papillatum]
MDLWKKAEMCSNKAGNLPNGKEFDEERGQVIKEGLGYADKCLEAYEQYNTVENSVQSPERVVLGNCYKWKAVLSSKWGELQGTKDKIKNSYVVRDAAVQACKILGEKDSVAQHMLGAFYFHLANLSWIEKNVASAIFHVVPTHTISEALPHLLHAQDAEPTFIRNSLMLGDCYNLLGDKDIARHWYSHCAAQKASCLIEVPLLEQCKTKLKDL